MPGVLAELIDVDTYLAITRYLCGVYQRASVGQQESRISPPFAGMGMLWNGLEMI